MQTTTQKPRPPLTIESAGPVDARREGRLLAGADTWHGGRRAAGHSGVEDVRRPERERGDAFAGGVTAAAFPAGTVLAATWNTALVERVGQALAEETQSRGPRCSNWAVNIHRSPLGGRNWLLEDRLPMRMAVAYINGLQSQGISACVKHYLANEQEFERFSISPKSTSGRCARSTSRRSRPLCARRTPGL